jgi:hypothetical protein
MGDSSAYLTKLLEEEAKILPFKMVGCCGSVCMRTRVARCATLRVRLCAR